MAKTTTVSHFGFLGLKTDKSILGGFHKRVKKHRLLLPRRYVIITQDRGGEAVAHLVSPSKWPAQGGNQEHGGWVSETWRRVRRLCWISLALGAYCMLMLAGELKTSRPQGSLSFDSTTLSSCRTNNQGVRRKRLVQRFTLLQEQRRW